MVEVCWFDVLISWALEGGHVHSRAYQLLVDNDGGDTYFINYILVETKLFFCVVFL
jgi:hypothetical protein